MSRWVLAAIVAIGCGHAAPAATPPARVAARDAAVADADRSRSRTISRKLVARAVAMYEDMARAPMTTDCAAATAKLAVIETSHADVIAANRHASTAPASPSGSSIAALAHQAELDAGARDRPVADDDRLRARRRLRARDR